MRKVLESERYYKLLADLERFRDHPRATGRACRPAHTEAARLVNNASRALDRARRSAARAETGPARDVALHRFREDIKRLLHVAESVERIYPKRPPPHHHPALPAGPTGCQGSWAATRTAP